MKKVFIIAGSVIALLAIAGAAWFIMEKKEKQSAYTNASVPVPEETIEAEAPEEAVEKKEEPAEPETSSPQAMGKEEGIPLPPEEKDEEPAKKESKSPSITNRLMSSGFAASSGRKIDTIVLHSSYDALGDEPYSVSGLIKEYEQYGVSAHYLIDRKGAIYRLVEDKNISYHAGVSKMKDGRSGVNDFSIGIELMNLDDGKSEYTSAQYASVNALVSYLKSKYAITSVVGHDDIAPGRKSDPWNFDWKKLK